MDEKQYIGQARRRMNLVGFTTLIYYGMMNFFVILVMIVDGVAFAVKRIMQEQPLDFDIVMEYLLDSITSNGWGYILCVLVGALILWLWKRKDFWKNEIFAKERKMTVGTFFKLLTVFLSAQLFAQLFSIALEWLLNLVGLSATAALEAAAITSTGFSMFLYITILGPISEELLFRGFLLRMLKPWGKQTAILVSALVFGLFHGNIIQIPFAFLVGLVLGYVTVEYSILWAMVLHIFNNLVMSDLFGRLAQVIPEAASSALLYGVLLACTAVAAVLVIRNRDRVKKFFTANPCDRKAMLGMVTSPGILIFSTLMLLMSLLSITRA